MRSGLRFLTLTLLIISVAETGLACGDKFVVFGRGVRFRTAYAAARPASILLFVNPDSPLLKIEREFGLESTLRVVGHKPRLVDSRNGLETALRAARYDIVLAATSDVAVVEKARDAAGADSSIIPALYKPTAEAFRTAQREYGCLLKVSKKNHDLLLVIDEVMRDRSKSVKDRCEKL